MKKAKVSLVSHTQDPIGLMCWSRRVMHSEVPDEIPIEKKEENLLYLGMNEETYFNEVLLHDGMPTFLEYVNFVFKLEHVSRALQQQLTRHRVGFSYSIQSLRCVDLPNFADNFDYTNPFPGSDLYNVFHQSMVKIQNEYRRALELGMPTQDARGLLPMNIHSTITFSCTLRALIGMVNKRLCLKTQDEFREVAQQIVKLVTEKEPLLKHYFKLPCDKGKCMMESECLQQLKEGKLTGSQNTDHVCPIFLKKWNQQKN